MRRGLQDVEPARRLPRVAELMRPEPTIDCR